MKMHMPVLSTIEAAAVEAMKGTAREVMAEARLRAPVEDGDLKRRSRIAVDDLEVRIVFSSPYAWIQHERLDFDHPNGGEAKFLENAIDALDVGDMVAGKVQAVLRGRH